MTKLLPPIFALGLCTASTAYAMPVAPLRSPQATKTIQVGYGCGLGVNRGPLFNCAPVHVYGGYNPYYRAYVHGYYRGYQQGYYEGRRDAYYPYVHYVPGDVVIVNRGVCGFGSYMSCSYGTCWQRCE
jgi:hypothetical protein